MQKMSSPRILMCRPDYFGIEYEINPWMNIQKGSDALSAAAQWNDLYQSLKDLNVAVELIDPVKGLPDLVFTANCGLVYENLFISSRFRFGVRQGEAPHFERWAKGRASRSSHCPSTSTSRGQATRCSAVKRCLQAIAFAATSAAISGSANESAREVLALELVDPRFYHLDTCFCPLAADLALYYPGAFDEYGDSVLRDRIACTDRSRRRGGRLV